MKKLDDIQAAIDTEKEPLRDIFRAMTASQNKAFHFIGGV